MVAANDGIGYYILHMQRSFQVAPMYAGIIMLAVVGYGLNRVFLVVEHCEKYRLNLKLWVLGSPVVARTDVRTVAYSHMVGLSKAIGETTHLCVVQHDEVIFIETIETNQALRAYTPPGSRSPVHCAAHGKAILAFQPDST